MTGIKNPSTQILLVVLAALVAGPTLATFEADLRAALDLHDQASSLEEQAKALEAFQQTASRYPDRWLGHFWTAYEETQIAMLSSREGERNGLGARLDRAQNHLSKLEKLHPSPTPRERSSIAMLQALVYTFRARFDPPNADRWQERVTEATDLGASIDPDNPVVWVMMATSLVRRGQAEGDRTLLLAARHFFLAGQAEAEAIADRSLTTYFNAEWIPFWLPAAEQALTALDR